MGGNALTTICAGQASALSLVTESPPNAPRRHEVTHVQTLDNALIGAALLVCVLSDDQEFCFKHK